MTALVAAFHLKNDKSLGFVISFILHVVLFAAGGIVLIKPIEYAVESGVGGIEISLVAAPMEAIQEAPAPAKEIETVPLHQLEVEEEMMTAPESQPTPQPAQEAKEVKMQAETPEKGDGSSPVVGKDSTTFHSAGGAETEARADYLRNPAPAYPWKARQKGWEGIVMLRVAVDEKGGVENLKLEKTSGYDILDQAALKTVKDWRFMPAKVGGVTLKSVVKIPVRFSLSKS